MSRTPEQIDADGSVFAQSLAGMTRSAAAKLVAKRYSGASAEALSQAVAATDGGANEVQVALAWARASIAALEALEELK